MEQTNIPNDLERGRTGTNHSRQPRNPSAGRHRITRLDRESAKMRNFRCHRKGFFLWFIVLFLLASHDWMLAQSQPSTTDQPELNDVHFHLTNYIQQGTDIHDF
ncbi:MAG TPA: hypothetical protein VEI50_01740 [Nitrospiraceae bacterium]|nr:hypothetical protein [Nitrospiraceae bacterium]